MDNTILCSACGAENPATAIFCMKCGKAFREAQLSTAIAKQVLMYTVSALLPPFGLGWAFKYVRQKDVYMKRIGAAIIVITIVSLIINIWILVVLWDGYFRMLESITDLGI